MSTYEFGLEFSQYQAICLLLVELSQYSFSQYSFSQYSFSQYLVSQYLFSQYQVQVLATKYQKYPALYKPQQGLIFFALALFNIHLVLPPCGWHPAACTDLFPLCTVSTGRGIKRLWPSFKGIRGNCSCKD
jgi:hypothetical protein